MNKRKEHMRDDNKPKRVKKECEYGEKCYRRNPAHFREFSHKHLESILNKYSGEGDYPIPDKYVMERLAVIEQLDVIVEKQLYTPWKDEHDCAPDMETSNPNTASTSQQSSLGTDDGTTSSRTTDARSSNNDTEENLDYKNAPDYKPLVTPTRRPEDFLPVVIPKGRMAAKHAATAPYYIFYTAITAAPDTHSQKNSITFQEILDPSLGELKFSLQINFMVELGWLLAHYYFAGYKQKKLTILHGEDIPELKTMKKNPDLIIHKVVMPGTFGCHHTKLMILCYENGSLRVIVSTANLYTDDWDNRTQGLWFSPSCPELPPDAKPHDGDSPTHFKRSLIQYLEHYSLGILVPYIERVQRCDFSHINVFLIASVPGSHSGDEWGMKRTGSLLRQHCVPNKNWALLAQASSLGSFGPHPSVWLTGDFLHNFTRTKNQLQVSKSEIKLIYPSLEDVRQSHDGLLGGGCLPYSAATQAKQPWIRDLLYQWRARSTGRNRAMPHIKTYTRICPDGKMAAYYILTSANTSKAAWGTVNKGNGNLRILSYEAGVLFLPQFVINKDFFSVFKDSDKLPLVYDIPPTKYASGMSPWVMEYLYE